MEEARSPESLQEWRDPLLCIEPKNAAAFATMQHNAGRARELDTTMDVRVKVLRIRMNEPNQRRGLVMFGRHPSCGVRFNDLKVASEHCFIDINPSSGELVLCDTSRRHQTYLDNAPVEDPPSRALVDQHAEFLRIHAAIFEIHWPSAPRERLQEYSQLKCHAAQRLRDDPKRLFTLTLDTLAVISENAILEVGDHQMQNAIRVPLFFLMSFTQNSATNLRSNACKI
ncbi:hypothetical protein GJ744_012194 [Endocarpon pusillum]|uniref:FHA domain-containing protein n=1 Tax=Endocarpon pusillum TaxID=364733 RepID=A0A8H7ABK2_9EURO|nr:hypothetical protein GJ744_012194 [Endocarpon pusillum]